MDRDDPPELFAVIDEAALHRPVGGDFANGTSAAYLESGLRGQVIQDAGDVSELTATWDRVAAEALPRPGSLKLIEEVAKQWKT